MSHIAIWLGYTVMVVGGVTVCASIALFAAYLCNVACSKALKAYGGWEVFKEFVAWHRNTRTGDTK